MKERQCVSCHQIPFMVWTLNQASRWQFDVDETQLRDWNEWATDTAHFQKPGDDGKYSADVNLAGQIDTMAFLLLGSIDFRGRRSRRSASESSSSAGATSLPTMESRATFSVNLTDWQSTMTGREWELASIDMLAVPTREYRRPLDIMACAPRNTLVASLMACEAPVMR